MGDKARALQLRRDLIDKEFTILKRIIGCGGGYAHCAAYLRSRFIDVSEQYMRFYMIRNGVKSKLKKGQHGPSKKTIKIGA